MALVTPVLQRFKTENWNTQNEASIRSCAIFILLLINHKPKVSAKTIKIKAIQM